jgi:hypothetical protein
MHQSSGPGNGGSGGGAGGSGNYGTSFQVEVLVTLQVQSPSQGNNGGASLDPLVPSPYGMQEEVEVLVQ